MMNNLYSIGDIHLYKEPVINPYRRQDNLTKELHYSERVAAYDYLKEFGVLPDYVKEVWNAPGGGGAFQLKIATVRYQRGLIYGEPDFTMSHDSEGYNHG